MNYLKRFYNWLGDGVVDKEILPLILVHVVLPLLAGVAIIYIGAAVFAALNLGGK